MIGDRSRPIPFALALLGCALAGCLALARASDAWASVAASSSVVVILWSVLRARFGPRPSRRFFWGFALAGGAYLALTYGPLGAAMQKDLVTSLFLNRLHPPPPVTDPASQARFNAWSSDHSRWVLVGHALFSLLSGLLGGGWATRVGRSADAPSEPPPATPPD